MGKKEKNKEKEKDESKGPSLSQMSSDLSAWKGDMKKGDDMWADDDDLPPVVDDVHQAPPLPEPPRVELDMLINEFMADAKAAYQEDAEEFAMLDDECELDPTKERWHLCPEPTVALCMRYLRGSKWRLEKAKEKYRKYRAVYRHLGPPTLESCRELLELGVMKVPEGVRDLHGRQVIFITPRLNDPNLDKDWQRARMAHFLLDRALSDQTIQERGFTGIMDMKDAPYQMNRTTQAQMDQLMAALPARMGGFYVVDPPWFFRWIFKMLRLFMSAKMKQRIHVLTREELSAVEAFPARSRLVELGGEVDFDNAIFLKQLEEEIEGKK